MIKNTKAQLSLFVIIGSCILVIGMLVFFSTSSTSLFTSQKPTYSIQEFTTTCLENQFKYALEEVGKKGGWYYTSPSIVYAKENTFNQLIKKAQGFEHPFYGELRYWRYFDENSNSFVHAIPSLSEGNDEYSIQNQVIRLVEETIDEHCLQEYSSFNELFTIEVELSKLEVSTSSFQEDTIIAELYLPLEIEKKDDLTVDSMYSFSVEIKNSIKIPYFIAQDAILAQENQSFIEQSFINFIYQYQKSGDNTFLPSFYDFKYSVVDYSVVRAEDKKPLLKQIFNTHSNEIILLDTKLKEYQREYVQHSRNLEFKPSVFHQQPFLSNVKHSNIVSQSLQRAYQNYESAFKYEPFFPLAFSFSNGRGAGEILQHSVFNQMLIFIPIKYTTYQAGYDITTPILFQVEDSTPNSDDDIVFNVPIEVNIKNNNPTQNLIYQGIPTFLTVTNSNYVASYCDPSHYFSKDVNVKLSEYDEFNNKVPASNVSFSFACSTSPQTVCQIPILNQTIGYNSNTYTLKLPLNCPNSELIASTKDALDVLFTVSSSSVDEQTVSSTFMSPRTLELNYYINGYNTLDENQQTVLVLEPKNNPQYTQTFQLNGKMELDNLSVELIPDVYSVTSVTIDNSTKILPKVSGTSCGTLEKIIGCVETPDLPSLELNGWVLSSFELQSYEITSQDLLNAKRIVLQIPGVEYPTSHSDLEDQRMPIANEKHIVLR